ncbi:tail fiber/spike domain-containing protein [Serratia fonticola]
MALTNNASAALSATVAENAAAEAKSYAIKASQAEDFSNQAQASAESAAASAISSQNSAVAAEEAMNIAVEQTIATIRVPDGEALSVLPVANERKGKFPGFDPVTGDVQLIDISSTDAASLALSLASTEGSTLVGTPSGTVEERFSSIELGLDGKASNDLVATKLSGGVTFSSGGTLFSEKDFIYNSFDFSWYFWSGSYEVTGKVIPPDSTPESSGGVGQGKWVCIGGSFLSSELAGNLGAGMIGTTQGVTAQSAINSTYAKNVYQVENYPGIYDSQTIDSSDALQALIDENPDGIFVLPENVAITKPIKYYSYTTIRGQRGRKAVVNIISGFPSDSPAFIPASRIRYAVQFAALEHLLIVDRTSTPDSITLASGMVIQGRGTTGTCRGIEITGTFSVAVKDVIGVLLDILIYGEPGAVNENQTTARSLISEIDVSNCNYIVKLNPATANWFPYGDIFMQTIKTTGSCKYGVSMEDLDGLHVMGLVAFASCGIRFSGNFAKFVGNHPFDPKIQISEHSSDNKLTAESFHICRRTGGAASEDIQLIGITSVNAGRLADTTTGSPQPNNIGAYGVVCENVQGLDISGEIKDPSMGGIRLIDCSLVNLNLRIRRANTQVLGSGALPPGTYNSIQIENCICVEGRYVDLSPSRNYSVYVDDTSSGINLSGVVGVGSVSNRFYRIPDNNSNKIELIAEHATGYKPITSGDFETTQYIATSNSPTPSGTGGRNNIILEFNNSSSTNVTDILSVTPRQRVIVNIRDNGATKLINSDNGGKFKGIDNNTQGRGTVLMFYRDPDNGYLVKI